MRIIGISGSLSKGSRTSKVIDAVLAAAAQEPDVTSEMIEISQANLVMCDGRQPDKYEGDTRRTLDQIISADCYVVGSPMFRGTYTGAFKNLFDLLPNECLKGKAVGLTATGGNDQHFLAIEHQLRPLFGFFGSYTLPNGIYANTGHFTDGRLNDDMAAACRQLGKDIVRLAKFLKG